MRKSSVVKLTLVPLLAASAMAYADVPDAPPAMDPAPIVQAPGMIDPALSPPGMTPAIDELDCDSDPNADLRDDCTELEGGGGAGVTRIAVYRGGYGGYWSGGGQGYGG